MVLTHCLQLRHANECALVRQPELKKRACLKLKMLQWVLACHLFLAGIAVLCAPDDGCSCCSFACRIVSAFAGSEAASGAFSFNQALIAFAATSC